MSVKSKLALTTAVLGVLALNTHQFRVNRELEFKISAAQKTAAKPKPWPLVVTVRKTVITEGGGREQISLAILQAPGVPTILRKVGAKFYPLTVDDIRQDPGLMKQLTNRFASISGQLQAKLQGYGLSPEAVESFHSIIAERDAQTYLLFLDYSQPGLDDGDLASFDAERRGLYDDADAQIGALINNADNFADYKASADQDDTGQQALQTFTSNLKRAASAAGEDLALSPEQNDALSSIMQEELANSGLPDPFVAHLMQASGMAVITPSFLQSQQMKETGTDITAFAPEKEAMLNRILDRAAQVLTPAQFAVFQQKPPDMMAMQMRFGTAQNLSMPITPLPFGVTLPPFGVTLPSGQLTIFPANAGGSSGVGGAFSYGIKTLPASP